jgi:hypothetical protein
MASEKLLTLIKKTLKTETPSTNLSLLSKSYGLISSKSNLSSSEDWLSFLK